MNRNMNLRMEYLVENKNKIILYVSFCLTLFLMLLGLRSVFELKNTFPLIMAILLTIICLAFFFYDIKYAIAIGVISTIIFYYFSFIFPLLDKVKSVQSLFFFIILPLSILLIGILKIRLAALISFFIVIIIPTGWGAIRFFDYVIFLNNLRIYMVQILLITIFLAWIINFIFKKKEIENPFRVDNKWVKNCMFTCLIWIIIMTIYFIYGAINNSLYGSLTDYLFIIQFLSLFISYSLIRNENDLKKILLVIIAALTIYAIFTIFISLFRETYFYLIYKSTLWEHTTRVEFQNADLYLIAVPLALAFLFDRGLAIKWKILLIISTILMIYSALIGQTRVLMSLLLFNIIIFIFIILKNRFKMIKINLRAIFIILAVLIVAISIFSLFSGFISSFSEIGERFAILSTPGKDPSLIMRFSLYGDSLILLEKKMLFGWGLGKYIIYNVPKSTKIIKYLGVDNAFLTIGYKTGLIGLFLFIYFIFIIIYNFFIKLKKIGNFEYSFIFSVLIWSIPILIFISTITSTHLLIDSIVTIAFMVISGSFFALNKRKEI